MAVSRGASSLRSSLQLAVESLSRPSPKLLRPLSSSRCFSTSYSRLARPSTRPILSPRPLSATSLSCHPSPHRSFRRTLFNRPVYSHYFDLPADYSDEVGLPFRRKDLETYEVMTIFGPKASTAEANKLLRILHGRRVAGTLDDPSVRINTIQYTAEQKEAALKYLRQAAPVDELINAGLRAEAELQAMEEQTGEEGHSPGDLQAAEKEKLGYASRFKLYKDKATTDVYGESALDKIRKRNVAKWRAEQKRREEEKRLREEEEAKARPGGLATADEVRPRAVSPRMEKWAEAAASDLAEAPDMPAWRRLLPSTVFVSLLVGGFVAYAYIYEGPDTEKRLLPEYPASMVTLGAIVLANVVGYLLWKVPPAWGLMNRYALVVAATPRPLSLLGAAFSHQTFGHLLLNMVLIYYVGTKLHDEIGRADFLATYVAGGSVGFLGTLWNLVLRRQLHLTTLGASGAFYGVATAYFWMHRFDGFKILGLPPDPAGGIQGLGFIGLLLALNLAAMWSKGGGSARGLDIVSHLTGMGVGLVAGSLLERKYKGSSKGRQMPLHARVRGVDKVVVQK